MDGASASERPFPSETLVTGFWIKDSPDGNKSVYVEVDREIARLQDLPILFDAMKFEGAQVMWPDVFKSVSKELKVELTKLVVVRQQINTPSGVLELVYLTDGRAAELPRSSKKLASIAGADFEFPAMPLVKMPNNSHNGDVLGSGLARGIAVKNADEIKTLGELMASTDLTKLDEFNKLQEKLREVWLFLNMTPDMTYVKMQK